MFVILKSAFEGENNDSPRNILNRMKRVADPDDRYRPLDGRIKRGIPTVNDRDVIAKRYRHEGMCDSL
jgi:hypothetical protein